MAMRDRVSTARRTCLAVTNRNRFWRDVHMRGHVRMRVLLNL